MTHPFEKSLACSDLYTTVRRLLLPGGGEASSKVGIINRRRGRNKEIVSLCVPCDIKKRSRMWRYVFIDAYISLLCECVCACGCVRACVGARLRAGLRACHFAKYNE